MIKVESTAFMYYTAAALVATMVWQRNGLGVLLLAVWNQLIISPAAVLGYDSCYSDNSSPYRFYSTHTDYEDVRGHGTDFSLPGCVPSKFYILTRHGIRYPTASNFKAIQQRVPELRRLILEGLPNSTLCARDQLALKLWKLSYTSDNADNLAETGSDEAYQMGVRFKHRFPSLLGLPYSAERYDFQHTYKPRTRDTAKAIARALFNQSDVQMTVNPKGNDPVLRFYDSCDKYVMTVDNQPNREQGAFQVGPEIHGVLENVTRRLGLADNILSFDDIYLLYEACAFDHVILHQSPWCAVFSDDELHVMEYWRDLKYYWQYGYGHSINYEQTCDLMKDIIGYLRNTTSSVTGMIRVAHDSTLLPLTARLGVFKDQVPLFAQNMLEQANRRWRSSFIASFGSNIVFVVYQCGSDSRVRVFHDEKPLALPMCPESGCPLSKILDSHVGVFANRCDLTKTCDTSRNCEGHVTYSGSCVPTIIG